MVSLPEPKYKNAGGPDDVFSREGRGVGRRSHAHSWRAPVKSTGRLQSDTGPSMPKMTHFCFGRGQMSDYLVLYF